MVRISFSTLFKEFKSTATWLQFPFLCGAAEGSLGDGAARRGEERAWGCWAGTSPLKQLTLKLSSEVDSMHSRRAKGGGLEQETLSSWKVGAAAPGRDVPHPCSPEQWDAVSGRR